MTALLICHVTKKSEIAGPRALEHNIDCAWVLRKAMNYRPLFVPKNRFGPETCRPLPLEVDPIRVCLRVSPHASTMTSVARSYLPGLGATEIQGTYQQAITVGDVDCECVGVTAQINAAKDLKRA